MCAHAGVCRVMDICRLTRFVSINVLMLILLTWSSSISVWYGVCINIISLVYIQLSPFFTVYVLKAIPAFFFHILKTSHNNFSQNRSQLLQDCIAQDVLHQCPTIFFYSSMTLHLLIPFKEAYLNSSIVCTSLPFHTGNTWNIPSIEKGENFCWQC